MIGIRNLNVFGSLDRPSNQSVCQHPQLTTWWVISVALKISIVALNGNMSKKCYKWNKKCSRTKSVPNRTRKVTKGTKNAAMKIVPNCMAFFGLAWSLWHFIILFFWSCTVFYGLFWQILIWLDLNRLFSLS